MHGATNKDKDGDSGVGVAWDDLSLEREGGVLCDVCTDHNAVLVRVGQCQGSSHVDYTGYG
jgi:hypothetical protein